MRATYGQGLPLLPRGGGASRQVRRRGQDRMPRQYASARPSGRALTRPAPQSCRASANYLKCAPRPAPDFQYNGVLFVRFTEPLMSGDNFDRHTVWSQCLSTIIIRHKRQVPTTGSICCTLSTPQFSVTHFHR